MKSHPADMPIATTTEQRLARAEQRIRDLEREVRELKAKQPTALDAEENGMPGTVIWGTPRF